MRAKRFGTKNKIRHALKATAPQLFPVRSFHIYRKSTTPFAGFWNQKAKEKNHTQRRSGRRGAAHQNFETRTNLLSLTWLRNPIRLGHRGATVRTTDQLVDVSATKSGQPWKGDIAGRKIKGRNYSTSGRLRVVNEFSRHNNQHPSAGETVARSASLPGGGYRSVSGKNKQWRISQSGKITGRGSWNNKGRAISGRNAEQTETLDFIQAILNRAEVIIRKGEPTPAILKRVNELKVAEAISMEQQWSRGGRQNAGTNGNLGFYSGNVRPRRGYSPQGETYTGNIKTRKRVTGGGNIAVAWNNNGRAIAGKHAGANGNLRFYSEMCARAGYSLARRNVYRQH